MKVRYVFPLNRPIEIEDHWPIPLLGGTCRLVQEDKLVTAIEFEKGGMPTSLSLAVDDTPNGKSVATIHGRDTFLPTVRDHIKRAFIYLQCFFDTEISVDEVKIHYEPENESEDHEIAIPWMHLGRQERNPLPITYDFITRALMAAQNFEGPEFVATLAAMARESFSRKRYIDSFRFSFLMIEALYGKGQFKSKALEGAFLGSPSLVSAIEHAKDEWNLRKPLPNSGTSELMKGSPSVNEVVRHLISMRGHYFHGNISKAAPWHPAKQEEAEGLAWLGIDLSQKIAADAALPMFADEFAKRHFDEAGAVGAHVAMNIDYKFRVPNDDLIRTRRVNFRMPGTKPTTHMAMEAAFRSIENFREQVPVGKLHSVSGTDTADGKQLFQMRFFTEDDGVVVKG